MVIVVYNNETLKTAYGLWQWDYGQILRIQGLNLPSAVEIHFSLQERGSDSVTRIGITKDGVTDVIIPDSMLENEGSLQDYNVYAFIYITDDTSGQTEYKIPLSVKSRPKPEAFEKPEDVEIFREAIKVVNEAAGRATESENNAKSYAEQASENARQTGEEREAVKEMVDMVSDIDKQVEAVKVYSQSAERAASEADSAANNAEQFKIAAERAGTEANDASVTAKEVAAKVAEDRVAVAAVKEDVDNVVHDFSDVVQQALDGVNTAGNEQIKVIGEKGKEVLESIPENFQTQIETKLDKNQGVENAGKALVIGKDGTVIPGEVQSSGDGIAIVNTTNEESTIVIRDSAERPIKDLKMFGKTEQLTTTGKNLFDIEKAKIVESYIDITIDIAMSALMYKLKPNTEYVLSAKVNNPKTNINIASSTKRVSIKNNGFGKIETNEDGLIYVGFVGSLDINEWGSSYVDVQLEEGSSQTSYEPYSAGKPSPSLDYPQKIVNAGKLNEETGKYEITVNLSSKNLFDREKAKILSNWIESNKSPGYSEFLVYVGTNKNVTISSNKNLNPGLGFFLGVSLKLDSNVYSWLYHSTGAFKETITLTTVSDYVVLKCSTTGINKFIENIPNLQIEISSEKTSYQPYKEQSITLTSDRPLTKWDRLEKRGEIWGWVYKSGEKIANSTDRLYINSGYKGDNTTNVYIEANDMQKGLSTAAMGFCNKLGFLSTSWSATNDGKTGFCYNSNQIHLRLDNDAVGILNDETIDAVKQKISTFLKNEFDNGKPFIFVYETKTETFVPLSELEQKALNELTTYYPTTVILNDVGANMEISYIADTKNYINKKFAEIQTALANTNAQLLNR